MISGLELEEIELNLLLDAVFHRYGYDFRDYARASLKRRVMHRMSLSGMKSISEMIPALLHNEEFFENFLKDMSITVTEMFRDPEFFLALRQSVIPILKTYAFTRIWHAGCSTGQEVYSTAIVLREEGLQDKVQIYATDYNNASLEIAREGIYPIEQMQKVTPAYQKAGGKASLSNYYHAKYNSVRMDESLRKNIVFAHHNLVTDKVFSEVHIVICRNVLIYFNKVLQNRVLHLFSDSLCHRGFLCLGSKESLDFTDVRPIFEDVDRPNRIFRKSGIPPAAAQNPERAMS